MRFSGFAAGWMRRTRWTPILNPQLSILSFLICKTVIAIYQKDFSTLPHILFLWVNPLRRYTPLEMTVNVKRHISEMRFVKCGTIPNSSFRAVVTCCVRMQLRIATASMSREIFLALGNAGTFNTPQPLCGYPFILHRHPPTRRESDSLHSQSPNGSLRMQFAAHRKRSPLPLKREGCPPLDATSLD